MLRPIKSLTKKVAVGFLKCHTKATGRQTRYVFVLAHMRSGSTLLSHILMSNHDILGFGERNAYYHTKEDLEILRLKTYCYHKIFLKSQRYFLDQINHNKFIGNADFLNNPSIRKIFLIREPVASISSMVNVLGKYYGTTLDQAVNYYVDRLSGICEYANALTDKKYAIFITYHDLIYNTQSTLLNLQDFLGLATELSENYEKFDFTGKRGDPGPNIHLGRVKREESKYMLDIPSVDLARIQKAYEDCVKSLKPMRTV